MTDIKTSSSRSASDLSKGHAERLAQEQFERAQQRQRDLADQRSSQYSPELRIRTWERLHALRLPSDPRHPVLQVIALGTDLTLAQVRQEQQSRLAQRAAQPTTSPAEASKAERPVRQGDPTAGGPS